MQKCHLEAKEREMFSGRWVVIDAEAATDFSGYEWLETKWKWVDTSMVSKKFSCVVNLCEFDCERLQDYGE